MADTKRAGKGSRCMIRAAKNRTSGKYNVQRARTERNKAARIARQLRRFPKYAMPTGWKWSQETKNKIVRA